MYIYIHMIYINTSYTVYRYTYAPVDIWLQPRLRLFLTIWFLRIIHQKTSPQAVRYPLAIYYGYGWWPVYKWFYLFKIVFFLFANSLTTRGCIYIYKTTCVFFDSKLDVLIVSKYAPPKLHQNCKIFNATKRIEFPRWYQLYHHFCCWNLSVWGMVPPKCTAKYCNRLTQNSGL